MITLVCGGARSGKSSFAEKIACHRGGMDVIYLATAEAGDKEMAERIKKHKKNKTGIIFFSFIFIKLIYYSLILLII